MALYAEIEYWSDYPAAGGIRKGAVSGAARCVVTPTIDGAGSCELEVPEDVASGILRGYVVRIEDALGAIYEYRIRKRTRTLGGTHRTLVGQDPLLELATVGPISQTVGPITSLDINGLYTPTEWIDTFILPYLTTRGMTYWSRGTVDFTAQIRLPIAEGGYTPLGLLRAIQEQTGGELQAIRVGTTGYQIALVTRVGSSAPTVQIELGRNLLALTEDEDDQDMASVVIPQGAMQTNGLPADIGENAWVIGTITGAGPYVVPLTDPAGGAAPVAFDDQLNGLYLLRSDGGTTAITDSSATGSTVTVAANTGLTAGEYVQIVKDASANRMTELTNPTQTARIIRVSSDSAQRGERNYLRNPLFLNWTDYFTPLLWSATGGAMAVGQYPRNTPASHSGIVTNGSQTAGAGGINFRGAPANSPFYANEYLVVGGNGYRVGNTVALADGSGNGSIVFASGTLPSTVADGQPVTFFGQAPTRPATFPTERESNNVLRLLSTGGSSTIPPTASQARLQSEAITIKYVTGTLSQLNAAAGWTITNGSGSDVGNTDGGGLITEDFASMANRGMPGIMLVDGTPTRLAYSFILQKVPASSTINAVTTLSYTMTADKTVRLCLISSNTAMFMGCRWVALWLGDANATTPIAFAQGNKLWQRGNRELLARALAVKNVSVTFRDLATVLGYIPTAENVQLGGNVYLGDLGITARVVGMTLDMVNPDQSTVTLDARSPNLVRFLMEKIT